MFPGSVFLWGEGACLSEEQLLTREGSACLSWPKMRSLVVEFASSRVRQSSHLWGHLCFPLFVHCPTSGACVEAPVRGG